MNDKRKYSSKVVDGIEKAPARAMLRAVGFSDEDFQTPQIGIASTWSMVTPCNMPGHWTDLIPDWSGWLRPMGSLSTPV